jgi:hypothetical protein
MTPPFVIGFRKHLHWDINSMAHRRPLSTANMSLSRKRFYGRMTPRKSDCRRIPVANVPMEVSTASPRSVTVDAMGRYVYVVNNVGNTVSQYTIGAGGALTSFGTAPTAGGPSP